MPIPETVTDREFQKFRESTVTTGEVVVKVSNPDGSNVAAGSGGTSMLDDAAFTPGGSSVTPVGMLADDVAPDQVDEGDIGAPRMRRTTRVQYVELVDTVGDSAMDDVNNALRVNLVAGGAGDGAIQDGVTPSIEATVMDTPGASPAGTDNPLLVSLNGTTLPALSAGTANIGDVDVLTLPSLPAGANRIGKVTIRNPADTLDLGDATNPLRTDPTGTTAQPVTDNAGSLTVDAVDLDVRNLVPAQDEVQARVKAQLDDTTPTLPAEDGYADLRITGQRDLRVNLRNNAGTELATAAAPLRTDPTGTTAQPVTDNAGSLTVDAPVATPVAVRQSDGAAFYKTTTEGQLPSALVTGRLDVNLGSAPATVTVDSELPAAAALSDTMGNPTAPQVGAALEAFDGTNYLRARGDVANGLDVDVTRVQGNVAVNTAAGQEVAVRPTTLDPLDDAGAAVPIKFVRINATADGDNVIIAAVGGKKIRVLGYALTATAAGTITIQDTQATPVIAAQFSLAAQGGVSYAGGLDAPAFETGVGFGVEINNPAGVDTLGHMTYVEL